MGMSAKVLAFFCLALGCQTLGPFFYLLGSHSLFINLGLGITLSQLVAYQSVLDGRRKILRRDLGVLRGLKGYP